MTDDTPEPEIVTRLVDRTGIQAAEAELEDAKETLHSAVASVEKARRLIDELRGLLPGMIERAAAGAAISGEEVAGHHRAVREAEEIAEFKAAVAKRLETPVALAEKALEDARHEAMLPLVDYAVGIAISAARKCDRALALTINSSDPAVATAADRVRAIARAEWDQADALLQLAKAKGYRWPWHYPNENLLHSWPPSEDGLRRYWSRPRTAEEMVADATA
ncbi:hypothetical protein JYK14_02945 [Siccirubricoccus sp. KC 17139]|uniref:DUF222 domain-containing protein n=1 Tax=Siccirubricoccus soli TaxID=2899147 RepID=A0ABT1CZP6_9PROT|nr:hypothetical protein [Siccirubricoccus soli]MCO6415134.1 hypothetical protein [Siccirubricoccus soli]MCP2681265.1 hypothetical protein [Siccirubricoccus soli]